jgi:hypothetical protein
MATAGSVDRWTAVTLLAMAAVFPAGIVGLHLFYRSSDWHGAYSAAVAPESAIRYMFPLSIAGAVVSLAAAIAVALIRQRVALRLTLFLTISLAVAYAVVGAWSLTLVSSLPLWWVYRLQHEA